MQFLTLILAVCFFIALFQVYRQSKDDFTLVRKNISLEQIFNLVIMTTIVGLAVARLIFALEKGGSVVVTFFSPYIPGLSLSAGLISGLLFVAILGKRRKLPSKKLLDILSLAIITVLPIGYLWMLVLSKTQAIMLVIFAVSLCLALFFTLFLYPRSLRGELKEGTVAVLFFLSYAILRFFDILLTGGIHTLRVFWQLETILAIGIFIGSIILLFLNERKTFFRSRR